MNNWKLPTRRDWHLSGAAHVRPKARWSRPVVRALSADGIGRPSLDTTSAQGPVMTGHFSVFNEWTEISSVREGHFMERIAPGAFAKTIRERGDRVRVLLEHGKDPQIGNRPLGHILSLREDSQGAAYEVALFDTPYVNDLLPALRAGQYGASFRFEVTREDFDPRPARSVHNPRQLPERTVQELRLAEFGPVMFPAYAGTSAGIRAVSLTDAFATAAAPQARPKPRATAKPVPTGRPAWQL